MYICLASPLYSPGTATKVEGSIQYNATSLQSVYKLDIARKVPMDGEISFTELASRCDIYEPDLKRILRFAMCYYHAFREPRKGFVSHTAVSRAIVESQGVRDALGVMFDECWPAYAKVLGKIIPLISEVDRLIFGVDGRGDGKVQKPGD